VVLHWGFFLYTCTTYTHVSSPVPYIKNVRRSPQRYYNGGQAVRLPLNVAVLKPDSVLEWPSIKDGIESGALKLTGRHGRPLPAEAKPKPKPKPKPAPKSKPKPKAEKAPEPAPPAPVVEEKAPAPAPPAPAAEEPKKATPRPRRRVPRKKKDS